MSFGKVLCISDRRDAPVVIEELSRHWRIDQGHIGTLRQSTDAVPVHEARPLTWAHASDNVEGVERLAHGFKKGGVLRDYQHPFAFRGHRPPVHRRSLPPRWFAYIQSLGPGAGHP